MAKNPQRLVALLRAVNVGGTGKLAMADLRAFFGELGFPEAKTVVQTGNVVFQSGIAPATLEKKFETEAGKRLGLKSDFMLRSAAEWRRIVRANPFAAFAETDPASMVVAFAKAAPTKDASSALEAATQDLPEELKVVGREIYVKYPNGQGRSKLDLAKLERKHPSIRATARNWNTVMKIAALLGA